MHDPGGKVRLRLGEGIRGDFELYGPSGEYRLWLSRVWGDPCAPYILMIGANPSVAEADVDDPTVHREIDFSKREGFTGYFKCNVMDYRATAPRDLLHFSVRPCSDRNLETIDRLAARAGKIVCCWGRLDKSLRRYPDAVSEVLAGRELWCFGRNSSDGSPKHPLYLSKTTSLVRFA